MRKIEQQMCHAVVNSKDWHNSNTRVMYSPSRQVSCVYLHNNLIAVVDKDTLQVYDGGWQSNTTKSRLNALCSAFAYAGEGIFQKDWTWYVRRWVGNLGAQSCWKTEEFVSGYLLA